MSVIYSDFILGLLNGAREKNWTLKAAAVLKGEELLGCHIASGGEGLNAQYSISKAYTATAIGMLILNGKLSEDDRAADYLPGFDSPEIDNKLKNIRIKHLLSNSMGTAEGYLFEADRHTHGTDDYLSYILSRPLEYEPGEVYVYSNSNFYLLSRIIEAVTGITTDEFIINNIFAPLNITEYRLTLCPMGHFLGGSGLFLKTVDMAKLGAVYTGGGKYRGEILLTSDYVERAIHPTVRINSKEGYGYAFMMKDSRFAFCPGNYNQLLLIDKEEGYTVGINSDVRPSESGTLMKLVRSLLKA